MLANIVGGLEQALAPMMLFYCFIGVLLGTLVGALPGVGPMVAISVLLPVTFYLQPSEALVMLAGIYYGGEYGGSIASILLNLPGSSSSAITCVDGHALTKRGRAGIALLIAALASFVGGSVGIIALMAFSPLLADFALSFGPADYFAIMLLGLMASVVVTQGSPLKGLGMVTVGILLGCVGTDVNTGILRFTVGVPELYEGIDVAAISMGLFGVAEIIRSIVPMNAATLRAKVRFSDMWPSRQDVSESSWPTVRGTAIGAALGSLPGTGPTIASFLAYAAEKRFARDPSIFGKGALAGVAAPEAANNAAAQTGFIPTLTLGIPGSPQMALMLGALMIHGIAPGPSLMIDHADVFWALVMSFWVGNILLLILNVPLISMWVKLLQIPYGILYPAIIALICVGIYGVNLNPVHVFIVGAFGAAGYAFSLMDFEPAPLIMGFILGPLMEQHFRRALLVSDGDWSVFLERPISATVLLVSVLLIAWSVYRRQSRRRAILAV